MDDIHGPFVLGSSSSAIGRVPTEIWAEIFAFARMIDTLTTLWHSPRQPPWNISYVCSLWRETVVSYSQLWLEYLRLEQRCLQMKDPVALLRLVLARSTSPIIIFFCETGFHCNHVPPVVRMLLQVLIDESASLGGLRIRVHPSYADLLPQFRGRVPLLDELDVIYDGYMPSIQGFEICPRLTSLALSGEGAFETVSQFPLSQVTDLLDSRTTPDDDLPDDGEYYANMVAAAPNLRYFETLCVPLTSPGVRVFHDTLTEIAILDVSLLSFFSFPSLERLAISTYPCDRSTIPLTDREEIGGELAAFVTQSHGCRHLTYLCVSDVRPTGPFAAMLEALPQLTELELPFYEWDEVTVATTEEFLSNLTGYVETDDNGKVVHAYEILPRLASFRLVFGSCPEAPDVSDLVSGAFRRMLEERYGFRGQRSALKSISLSVSSDSFEVPTEVFDYFKGLKRLGLDIEVVTDKRGAFTKQL